MSIQTMLFRMNRSSLWRNKVNVWGNEIRASSLDRLLCLWLHRTGLMGKKEYDLLQRQVRPGMSIVEIGANLGIYTLLFSKLTGPTGKVFSFEPEPNLFNTLCDNCQRNFASNVTPYNCALGAHPGAVCFYQSIFNSGDNRLGNFGWAGKGIDVQLSRLDDVLAKERVDFIKMDVQGYELHVLRGMPDLLSRNRALEIYLEFWPHGLEAAQVNPNDLLDFLHGQGFHIHQQDSGVSRPVLGMNSLNIHWSKYKFINLLATRR